MYLFNATFSNGPWGVQGGLQFRNWNVAGDLEQLLLRAGLTYQPKKANVKFTLGYGNITSGTYRSNRSTSAESRIYQEVLLPSQLCDRLYINHRFRYEQRFVENQHWRTRYRYNVAINIALNKAELTKNTLYISLYNELFINGQRGTGNGNTVELFDRNRFYLALGYVVKKGLNIQCGMMNQTTDNWSKNQFQLSLHQTFMARPNDQNN